MLDLWDMAKSANFTEKELESFREELKLKLKLKSTTITRSS